MIPSSFLTPAADVRPEPNRLYRAVRVAKQRYPGPVGDYLAREIELWRDFGYRFENGGRMGRLVDALLDQEAS